MADFTLPTREGQRPKTGDHVPHLQLSDTSPPEFVVELMDWAVNNLPDVREEPTRISVSSTRALWLDESVSVAHDDSFMPPAGSREFAHVHADGSMHLCMSDDAVREIVEKSWGEPHPMKDEGVNEVLCYAPKNREELETVKFALVESYRHATGRAIDL
jgi:hypothetical protein